MKESAKIKICLGQQQIPVPLLFAKVENRWEVRNGHSTLQLSLDEKQINGSLGVPDL